MYVIYNLVASSTLSTGVSTATGCAPIFPIVQTVNKSADLLAGFAFGLNFV